MPLARVLLGHRVDLDLAGRWWHRPLLVLAVLGVTALGIWLWLTQPPRLLSAVRSDVTVLENLEDFTQHANPDIPNTVPAFLRRPGYTGDATDGRVIVVIENHILRANTAVCSADLMRHLDQASLALGWSLEQVRAFVTDAERSRHSSEDRPHCILDQGLPNGHQIVKFKLNAIGWLTQWGPHALFIVIWSGCLAVAALNVYYLLVLLIFGVSKRVEASGLYKRVARPPAQPSRSSLA